MTGPLKTKKELKGAKVCIYLPDKWARVIHLDIEHPDKKISYQIGN